MSVAERDFPKGHPKAGDYDPASPEAIEWARVNIHTKGERDFPVDHPKAVDTVGNTNATEWRPGVDPAHPELEALTGATAAQAAGRKAAEQELSKRAKETPTLPGGIVDLGAIARNNAIAFVVSLGNTEEKAAEIVDVQGVEQILAAQALMRQKG
jgi:hypothetical protein